MTECIICHEKKDVLEFYTIESSDHEFTLVCKTCKKEGHNDPKHIQDERKYSEVGTRRRGSYVRSRG